MASEQDSDDDADGVAVLVLREQAGWTVVPLPDAVLDDLDAVVAAVRAQAAGVGTAFALVNVADEFFVVVRAWQGQVRVLLSDVTAALDWDLAEQVLDLLDLDVPDDDDEVWPVGDLGLLDDLGVDEVELGAIVSDLDAYADEMLGVLAGRLGFAEAYERVVDAVVG